LSSSLDPANRVSLYRKDVKAGERLRFKKMVLLILGNGAEARVFDPQAPVDARTEPPPSSKRPASPKPAR
jgi:hypothetical protein